MTVFPDSELGGFAYFSGLCRICRTSTPAHDRIETRDGHFFRGPKDTFDPKMKKKQEKTESQEIKLKKKLRKFLN